MKCPSVALPRPGVWAMLLASFLFSLNTAIAKLLAGRNYSPYAVLYFRGLCTTLGASCVLLHAKRLPIPHEVLPPQLHEEDGIAHQHHHNHQPRFTPDRSHVGWAFARGLLGAAAIGCLYVAVSTLPLTEAVTLYSLNPVFANLFARLLLKEPVRVPRMVALLLFVAGAVVVSDPTTFQDANTTDAGLWVARGIAVVGSGFSGAALMCARKLGTLPAHFMAQAWWQGAMSALFAPFAFFIWSSLTMAAFLPWYDAFIFFAMALCAFGGQCCVGFAVQKESAGIIGVLWNLDILFSFLWQISVFSEAIEWYQGVGVASVTIASILIVLEKHYAHLCCRSGDAVDSTAPATVIVDVDEWPSDNTNDVANPFSERHEYTAAQQQQQQHNAMNNAAEPSPTRSVMISDLEGSASPEIVVVVDDSGSPTFSPQQKG